MVLLHQSVSKCGKALEVFKAEIEMHFEDLKQEIEGFEEATLYKALLIPANIQLFVSFPSFMQFFFAFDPFGVQTAKEKCIGKAAR